MKQVTLKFKSRGTAIKKVVVIKDDLSDLSKSKRNENVFIFSEPDDGYWAIYFSGDNEIDYEIQFAVEDYRRTLIPIKAITWVNDVIQDVQLIDDLTIR